jgi:hypothetical protein
MQRIEGMAGVRVPRVREYASSRLETADGADKLR